MPAYILSDKGAVRMGLQGVNTPDTPATLTSSHVMEFEKGFSIKYEPDRKAPEILAPKRQGQKLDTVGNVISWGGSAVQRDFTVPAVADTTRPSDHAALRAAGFIEVYSDAGPYTLIYTPQDAFELMDLATIALWEGAATEAEGLKHLISGAMCSHKFKLEPAGCRTECDGGLAQAYTESDAGAAIPIDALPSTQRLMLQGATLLLETVGGGTVYSGPLASAEGDLKMNVGAIMDGTAAGFIDRVTLAPKEAPMYSFVVARQLRAAFHAQKIRDTDRLNLHAKITIPTLGNSLNVRIYEMYGSISSIEDGPELGSGAKSDKINMAGLWFDATTPGVTPAKPMTITIKTTAP